MKDRFKFKSLKTHCRALVSKLTHVLSMQRKKEISEYCAVDNLVCCLLHDRGVDLRSVDKAFLLTHFYLVIVIQVYYLFFLSNSCFFGDTNFTAVFVQLSSLPCMPFKKKRKLKNEKKILQMQKV